jgi:hypothetical protein
MAKAILDATKADCKIGAFFTGLALTDEQHLQDCFAIQLGEFVGCDGKVYAGSKDMLGQPCLSMADGHQNLQIRSDDFDAFTTDVIAALKNKGMTPTDVSSVVPSFLSTKGDVVQSGDQGLTQSTCPGADAGTDADAGPIDSGKDTGIADAADSG